MSLISEYGRTIAEYHGEEGALTLKDGTTVNCTFEAGQLSTGEVLLLCDFAQHFHASAEVGFDGKTTEGAHITGDMILGNVPYLPALPNRAGSWGAFRLNSMNVEMMPLQTASCVRFGLTNFMFVGSEPDWMTTPLVLKSASAPEHLSVVRIKDYDDVKKRLRFSRSSEVTSEVVADVRSEQDVDRLTQVVDNLCHILSVARGTRVQCAYRYLCDDAGQVVHRRHCSPFNKPYCSMEIIDSRASWSGDTKTFVETTYATYVLKRDHCRLNRGTIYAYLEAKAEDDNIQRRGAKLAVAMEMLKSEYIKQMVPAANNFIIDRTKFAGLMPGLQQKMREVFCSAGVDLTDQDTICANRTIRNLNRIQNPKSFESVLRALCKNINLSVKPEELDLFVRCRNSLIHEGQFYVKTATPEKKAECAPKRTECEEFFFLVNFVDKVFLKLLGYSGPYLDYSDPDKVSRTAFV